MRETRRAPDNGLLVIVGTSLAVIGLLIALVYLRSGGTERAPLKVTGDDASIDTTTVPSIPTTPTTAGAGTASTAAGATTTTAAATTTTEADGPAAPAFTMAFAGDLLPHTAVNEQAAAYGRSTGKAYDYSPMLAPMRDIIGGADLAICHMEVPTVPVGEQISTYPSFGAPPELVDGAASAGYDGCSTASNHSLDRGRKGLNRLLDTLDANKMQHNGTARTEAEGDGRATIYDVDGYKVAHLSYAYGFNGYKIPADAPWSVNQIDPAKITARAAEAKAAGADLVVVSMHWGTEYVHDPTAQQQQWADAVMASPAVDLIVGHHAHVVQPIGKVNGKFVVWGLGNQVSNQTQLPRRDGLTVRVHVEKADGKLRVASIDAIPTYVDLPSFHVLPVVETLKDGKESPSIEAQLRESYARTAAVINGTPTEGVNLAPLP